MKLSDLPATQIEAIRYFADEARCHDFLAAMRWPDGVHCAHCQSANVGKLVVTQVKSRSAKNPCKVNVRRLWNCKSCRSQFTVKTGTIFQDSPLGLEKWLPAVWMICNAKNGVSSCELARALGVTQKSAWFMGHRIRAAMREGSFEVSGTVEADETYFGPTAKKMNKKARESKGVIHRGTVDKTAVLGILQRSETKHASRVITEVLESNAASAIQKHVRDRVQKGAAINTDAHRGYVSLNDEYNHSFVDHAVAYANGAVHTNGIENFWSILKRTIRGTYVHVAPFHLFRYLDEQATRFNERADNDQSRFLSTIDRVSGRRLSYAALTKIGLI